MGMNPCEFGDPITTVRHGTCYFTWQVMSSSNVAQPCHVIG